MTKYINAILFLLFAFLMDNVSLFAFTTEGGGHKTIMNESAAIQINKYGYGSDFEKWIEKAMTGYGSFLTGIHDEDCTYVETVAIAEGASMPVTIPISGFPQGPNSWGNFFEHFYNPQTGVGLWGNKTAIARAKEYEGRIKGLICNTKGQKYSFLSTLSREKVNDYFGRIQHLVQDMGVSYHTKLETHPFHAPVEGYVRNNWNTIVSSDLFTKELADAKTVTGFCVDPTTPMLKLALWSHNELPNKKDYQKCDNIGGRYFCYDDMEKIAYYSTRMAARATKFAASYIDQIYNAINADCLCKDEPPGGAPTGGGGSGGKRPPKGPGGKFPDDNYAVSDWAREKTQFGYTDFKLLDFYMRLAMKKGNITPFYIKQFMNVYAEGKALPDDATDEQKNIIEQKFTAILDKLNAQPAKDIETSPDVAVLQNGFYEQTTVFLNKINEPLRLVPVDFDPSIVENHPVLVIPSGGLYGLKNSMIFRAILDEYVKLGGTLIVFSQAQGDEFSILPVPQETDGSVRPVMGYGWEQDINCFTDSVFINTQHPIFSGQSRITPTLNVDGYLSTYPSNASVLLNRTLNGQPVMIMYDYGQGKVIVTTTYPDYAYSTFQSSKEESALQQDLISWAKKPAVLPGVKPGESISIPVSVINVTDTAISQIKLLLYGPDRSQIISEQIVSTSLAAHTSTDITVQYTAPTALGIYHVDYMLLDGQGNIIQPQTETDSGRFAVNNPPVNPYKSPDFNFSATTITDQIPYGDDVPFTIHIWNNTTQTRTITAKYVFPHMYMNTHDPIYGVYKDSFRPASDTQWITKTVTVSANGKVSFDHVMTNAIHDEFIYVNFYDENNKYLGSSTVGFFLYNPSANMTVATDKKVYIKNETINVTAIVTNKSVYIFSGVDKIHCFWRQQYIDF